MGRGETQDGWGETQDGWRGESNTRRRGVKNRMGVGVKYFFIL